MDGYTPILWLHVTLDNWKAEIYFYDNPTVYSF